MTRTPYSRFGLVLGAVLLTAAVGMRARAQEAQGQGKEVDAAQKAQEELDRTPTKCVVVNRISRKVAANNSQVVFFMKGGTNYLNVLDGACAALTKGETRLVYQLENQGSQKLNRLCDTDGFTVERQTSRVGCSLGQFIPITAEEAAALVEQPAASPAATPASPEKPN
jgi:hypothetical protein